MALNIETKERNGWPRISMIHDSPLPKQKLASPEIIFKMKEMRGQVTVSLGKKRKAKAKWNHDMAIKKNLVTREKGFMVLLELGRDPSAR